MAAIMATGSDLSCGICLELFKDPRILPCLHTFCRGCLENALNGKETLKCPVCRAKHELTVNGVALLPVDEFALQGLPLKKLQQISLGNVCQNCEFCGEQELPVAWCGDCNTFICKNCLAFHKKMAFLRSHSVVQAVEEDGEKDPGKFPERRSSRDSFCLRHSNEQLKYFCKCCQEAVCCDCLLLGHKDHQCSTVSDARLTLGERLEALAKLVSSKKEEFEAYLVKLRKVETTEMESSERMKVEVDKIFDAIVAAVEAQRNEALKTVSQRLKEIWAQKELMEVSLAQLDSFTQFTGHTEQCLTDSAYVAMATQGMKLMKQLKDCHGNEGTLENQLLAIGSQSLDSPINIPLEGVFQMGQHPTVTLTPPEESEFDPGEMRITIALEVGGLPVSSMSNTEGCELCVDAWLITSEQANYHNRAHQSYYHTTDRPVTLTPISKPEVRKIGLFLWEVAVPSALEEECEYLLKYKLTGAVEMEAEAKYSVGFDDTLLSYPSPPSNTSDDIIGVAI